MGQSIKYVFFLGGIDTEMLEIEKILKSKKQTYFNKNLSWGAKLSDYESELKKIKEDEFAVLIELLIDNEELLPKHHLIIDHHNEYSITSEGKPQKSSLEQIATLLNVPLSRDQLLIACNDVDIYRGLRRINATQEEIEKIDNLEFNAQGINDKDLEQAKTDLENNSLIYKENDLIIIKTKSYKTRPFFKFLFDYSKGDFIYKHIFILTKTDNYKMTFYSGTGEIVNRLKNYFHKDKYSQSNTDQFFFYGGNLPETGYFGINQILNINFITNLISERTHSSHIFLFPFVFDKTNQEEEDIFDISINENLWERENLSFNQTSISYPIQEEIINKYNKLVYFYQFINETLYSISNDKKPYSICFKFKNIKNRKGHFVVYIKTDTIYKIFCLDIFSIRIHFFKNNIGIVEIGLHNKIYDDPNDILLINDFGRRIYPQFIGEQGAKNTKDIFLAEEISIQISDILEIKEDFSTEKFINVDFKNKLYIVDFLNNLISDFNTRFNIKPILDDRLFVICWYGSNQKSTELKYDYKTNIWWYRFIFIDGKYPGIANKSMMEKLISNSTYARFQEWGTLYGISRYSFVCLSDTSDFAINVLRNHIENLYKTMVLIVLAQRASIIALLDDIKTIDPSSFYNQDYISNSIELDIKLKNVEKIYISFMSFLTNLNNFEVTAQEQGIELYKLLMKKTNINNQLKVLENRIDRLHSLINFLVENKSNKIRKQRQELIEKISVVSNVFVPFFLFIYTLPIVYPYIKFPNFLSIAIPIKYLQIIWVLNLFLFFYSLSYNLFNENYHITEGFQPAKFYIIKSIARAFYPFGKKVNLLAKLMLFLTSILFISSIVFSLYFYIFND